MKNKAIFLDRDGTIIIDKGYLDNPKAIEFIKGIPEVLKALKEKGYLLIVVSNQSGVARGYFNEKEVKLINNELNAKLVKEYGIAIDRFYYCPHHPEYGMEQYKKACSCRKPKPGMILQAVADFDIDIENSLMIGDKDSDRIDIEGLAFMKTEKDSDWSKFEMTKYVCR